MKRLFLTLTALIAFASICYADVVTLGDTENLTAPQSQKMIWKISEIDATAQRMVIDYYWLDENENAIKLTTRTGINTWICRNIADDPDTPEDETDTCFTDVFGFQIRAQDVGTKIGVGLRTLIWNKFKDDVLSTGNTGSFDAN